MRPMKKKAEESGSLRGSLLLFYSKIQTKKTLLQYHSKGAFGPHCDSCDSLFTALKHKTEANDSVGSNACTPSVAIVSVVTLAMMATLN